MRDTGAFLKWGRAAEGNPCAGALERSVLFGVSQSGRFLRHLLYLGLDEDEQGRMVFDAVLPHVAGGRRGEFNMRFGQPSVNAQEAVGSLFPFADEPQTDPVTGQRDGLLARIAERGRAPKIFATNTSAEYWRSDASLIHTDVASGPRRRAAGRRADLSLRRHAAHAGRAAAAGHRSQHGLAAACSPSTSSTTRRCSAPRW